ncbi:lipopolysaccharide biosynthesis protein [uncultured Deinococcus sp.]|uniref:lipopolysaccharide biosynthesis protein n=1 Tax=uncultured Deinococcus sp. TaxID=158789 RepID=UPI0025FF9648|nr:lipopolysaccharide biosynthesis protein [uncultured Deinococcus sp.]
MTLVRHSLIYVVARGVPGLLNFAALSVFSHLLDPAGYGQYALVIAISSLLNSVLFEWLHLGLLRYLPTGEERVPFLRTIVGGYALVVAATAVLGGVSLLVVDDATRPLVVLALVLTWGQVWFELTLELLRAQLKPLHYGLLALTRAVLSLGLGVLLVRAGLGSTGRLLGLLLGAALPGVLWSVWCWRGAARWDVNRETMRTLLSYGLPLTVTFAFGFILSTSDRLLLGALQGAAAAGIFSVGMDLAQQSLGLLMAIVNLAAYPLAVRALNERGEHAAREQLIHNGSLLLAVAVPATVGLAALAPQIARVALGADFQAAAAQLIPWVALSALLMGLKAYHLDLSFQLGQNTRQQIWIVLNAAAVNVGLNMLWIPRLGYMGCAYASAVAALVALLLSWFWGRQSFPVPVWFPNVPAVLLGSAALYGTELLLATGRGPLALLGQIVAGGAAYAAVYLVTSSDDRARVQTWWAGRSRAARIRGTP